MGVRELNMFLRNQGLSSTRPADRLLLFVTRIKISDPQSCWEWQGARTPLNYGSFGKDKQYAHRESYRVFRGEIPEGMSVCHKCDNPICVNPLHLFLGSHAENMKDKAQKGRVKTALSQTDVIHIRKLLKEGITGSEIARRYNVRHSTISRIKLGKGWRYVF